MFENSGTQTLAQLCAVEWQNAKNGCIAPDVAKVSSVRGCAFFVRLEVFFAMSIDFRRLYLVEPP